MTGPVNQTETQMQKKRIKRRVAVVLVVAVAVLLLVLLPPLINVNRFRHRIANNISGSLGRPVHLDNVSISMLPLPSLTLDNFVVSEDPLFGAEPVMRASTVHATLRWSSLWRGRVEFSTISLDEPSVNLVQTEDGRWNIESILLHAASVEAAPTAQKRAGASPRFPYIEATDGRINLKLGEEKTPLSFTGAEFALWLPNPEEWRLRMRAKPARTDTDASDTGEFRAEATLRRASVLSDVPVQMEMHWKRAPLGEASKVMLGYEAGWRGDAEASLLIDGTLGDASVTSQLHLTDVRRADFVPERPMDLDAHCEARATDVLRRLRGLRCSVQADPAAAVRTAAPSQIQNVPAGTLSLTGDVPNVMDWNSADLSVSMASVAPGYALDWLRLFSIRIPHALRATGSIDGNFTHGPATEDIWAGRGSCDCALVLPTTGGKESSLPVKMDAVITGDGTGGRALQITVSPLLAPSSLFASVDHVVAAKPSGAEFLRGGKAIVFVDSEGFQAHLPAGNPAEFLPALGERFPPLLDGMPPECGVGSCTLVRRWGSTTQAWSVQSTAKPPRRRSR